LTQLIEGVRDVKGVLRHKRVQMKAVPRTRLKIETIEHRRIRAMVVDWGELRCIQETVRSRSVDRDEEPKVSRPCAHGRLLTDRAERSERDRQRSGRLGVQT